MKPVRRYSNDLFTNQGWKPRDTAYLREYDNPARGPGTQIFLYSEEEDEEETTTVQESTKWCPTCSEFTLQYLDY